MENKMEMTTAKRLLKLLEGGYKGGMKRSTFFFIMGDTRSVD